MPRHNESPHSFAVLQNRLHVTGTLVALTALRIGSGRSHDISGSDLPVLRDAQGQPFLPGASLKGAFRARLEALIRAVRPDQALDLGEIEAWQRTQITQIKADEELTRDDRTLSKAIWDHSTMIDLTFGAPWIAGRLFIKDALVLPGIWFGQHETRNGVALNRDTETAEEGLLYNYEVTPAGTRFDFELILENAEPWQRGMVLAGLKPWEYGEVSIGGFRSRGLGRIKLEPHSRRFSQIDDVEALIDLLINKANEAGMAVSSADEREWIEAFKERLANPPVQAAAKETPDA